MWKSASGMNKFNNLLLFYSLRLIHIGAKYESNEDGGYKFYNIILCMIRYYFSR